MEFELPSAKFPRLNFPCRALKIRPAKGAAGQYEIRDLLRGGWLRLTPEEWVRQHLAGHLLAQPGLDAQRIVREHPIALNGQAQRADVAVFAPGSERIVLLAECKAPGVAIGDDTLAQAVRYNSVAGARYVMLTNGLRHYLYELLPSGRYVALDKLPLL